MNNFLVEYTTIKLENDAFFPCENGGSTGDVLERCKNRWSCDVHDNSEQVHARK